ncbi:hypothetical protein OC835_007054 [Tilletia horrida]|uniref:Uncharacterized protein n=1 Tax=Tilletia horrida TaxID=155126 RepID=A0AAN6G7F0_9BASI|nr:hypothetical protein OC842_007055 [Tilletia horrida]KAK0520905.1 hypothetical protein OC835_007054 [Tilletia horrida]KAK0548856.1 hypothetical protein OC844_006959 [Tilletia horrida]
MKALSLFVFAAIALGVDAGNSRRQAASSMAVTAPSCDGDGCTVPWSKGQEVTIEWINAPAGDVSITLAPQSADAPIVVKKVNGKNMASKCGGKKKNAACGRYKWKVPKTIPNGTYTVLIQSLADNFVASSPDNVVISGSKKDSSTKGSSTKTKSVSETESETADSPEATSSKSRENKSTKTRTPPGFTVSKGKPTETKKKSEKPEKTEKPKSTSTKKGKGDGKGETKTPKPTKAMPTKPAEASKSLGKKRPPVTIGAPVTLGDAFAPTMVPMPPVPADGIVATSTVLSGSSTGGDVGVGFGSGSADGGSFDAPRPPSKDGSGSESGEDNHGGDDGGSDDEGDDDHHHHGGDDFSFVVSATAAAPDGTVTAVTMPPSTTAFFEFDD